MKPLGTITAYVPFLDSVTSRVVLEEMEAAEDYTDFVKHLCDRVCLDEVTELAVFLAARHALNIDAVDCLAKISEMYGNVTIVRPILFVESAQLGDKEGCAKAREAADAVLATRPPDWLAIEMHVLKIWTAVFDYPAGSSARDAADHIEAMISRNASPAFFGALLYASLALVSCIEGDIEAGVEQIARANALAVECDNQFLLAKGLQIRALYSEFRDRKKCRETLRAAGNILKTLGDMAGLADVIRQLGELECISGGYSAAIQDYMEVVRILETLGAPTVLLIPEISGPYAAIGDGESALAWAKMAEVKGDATPSYIAGCRLDQARALVLLGELQQARDIVESTRESVFKSGRESNLMWLHFVEGMLEIAEGNYSRGSMSLEEALQISERSAPRNVNDCILQLARAEVLAAVNSCRIQSDEEEGYWLARLEDSARSEDKPGILGQALLLKAELYLAQHKHQEARTVLQEVSSLAADPGLEFLRGNLDRLLEQVDDLP